MEDQHEKEHVPLACNIVIDDINMTAITRPEIQPSSAMLMKIVLCVYVSFS